MGVVRSDVKKVSEVEFSERPHLDLALPNDFSLMEFFLGFDNELESENAFWK